MLLTAGFVACSSPPSATAAGGSEASSLVSPAIAMEEFETSFASGSCAVKWRGNPTLAVEQCKTALAPQSVPIVVAGITYAVWATESCSSGGACAGMQFYAITTHGTSAWASPAFGHGYRLTRIMPRPDGITLELEPAADTGAAVYFELRMGDVRNEVPNTAPTPPVAAVLPPSEEEPKIVQMRDGCALAWGGQILKQEVGCGDPPQNPLKRVASVSTPDTHFYIYGSLTDGEYHACEGNTYYLVGVTATQAWSPEEFGLCAELGEVKTTNDGISFTLDDINGTTTCEVTGMKLLCSNPVPRKRPEPKILSTRRITVTGQLGMGPRLASHKPVIYPTASDDYIVISDAGPCAVEDNYDHMVQSTLSCDELDDDSTICTCEQLRVLD
jgi:hypothetical protein